MRDTELRDSRIVEDIRYNPWIRLSEKENPKLQYAKGEQVNDIELIPLRRTPMILISTLIEDVEVPNKPHLKRQKVVTRPELDSVHKDLFSIILNMHGALQEIDRVDALVFPLLQLEDPHLLVPDAKNNE